MAIRANDLGFSYHQSPQPALTDVTLSVSAGECVVLCGQSGCGKTTLLRILNGLIGELFSGQLSGDCVVLGKPAGQTGVTELVPLVGSVFQNPKTQYFNVDTTSELAFPCENSGMEPEEIQSRIDRISALLQLEALLGRSIFKLSGGEKQRIAFGAACMLDPKLLVLDEPTGNLDDHATDQLHHLIGIMKQRGVTIVIAEHRLAWICDLADRYLYFSRGKLADTWTAGDLLQKPPGFLEQLGLRPVDITPYRQTVREKEALPPPAASPLLQAKSLAVGYGKKAVCTVEDFSICPGEIVCLMGPNGVGKTTLVQTLCGLQKPLSGQILWQNSPATSRRLIQGSFMVMQDVNYQLFADSVREEVLLGARHPELCDQILDRLTLTDCADRHPVSLSGGQKQRVAICSAILAGKQFVVLDEPTSGLDYYHMMQVSRLLQQLKHTGAAVLVVTHDRELAAICADRIVTLRGASES